MDTTNERPHLEPCDACVTVVVAAGNSDNDASNYSPARPEQSNTVTASVIGDARAYFYNYGAPVNIFAAGLDVILSGTSMATPHDWFRRIPLGIDSTLTSEIFCSILHL